MIHSVRLLVLIFLNIGNLLYSQETWEIISKPVSVDLQKVYYLDSLHIWAAGDSGTIIFSSDKGYSWQVQNDGLANSIQDIFFLNNTTGWAVTWILDGINYQSLILKTSNGGISWEQETYPIENIIIRTIFFIDSNYGWVGGDPAEFGYTSDGGRNWNPVNFDTLAQNYHPIRQIKFSNFNYGFAVGGSIDLVGTVCFTNDSGKTWKAYQVAPDIFDDFIFTDTSNVLSLSADVEFIYPIGKLKFDLNQNFWTYEELNHYGRVTSLAKRTESDIWGSIGNAAQLIFSKDYGQTWNFISTPDNVIIFNIAFSDSLSGIGVGQNGNVIKYNPSGSSQIFDANYEQPTELYLYQNFPNPFNPSTKISWKSAIDGQTVLKIFDLSGNDIGTLINEFKPAGFYDYFLNLTTLAEFQSIHLSSGVYFYQLRVGESIRTKKMMILR